MLIQDTSQCKIAKHWEYRYLTSCDSQHRFTTSQITLCIASSVQIVLVDISSSCMFIYVQLGFKAWYSQDKIQSLLPIASPFYSCLSIYRRGWRVRLTLPGFDYIVQMSAQIHAHTHMQCSCMSTYTMPYLVHFSRLLLYMESQLIVLEGKIITE